MTKLSGVYEIKESKKLQLQAYNVKQKKKRCDTGTYRVPTSVSILGRAAEVQPHHLDDGGELVEGVADVLLRHLVRDVVHVDRERLLRPAWDRDLQDQGVSENELYIQLGKVEF